MWICVEVVSTFVKRQSMHAVFNHKHFVIISLVFVYDALVVCAVHSILRHNECTSTYLSGRVYKYLWLCVLYTLYSIELLL